MMGAGGITETITCIKAVETGIIPPTINLNEVDPECAGIDFVPQHRFKEGGHQIRVMSNRSSASGGGISYSYEKYE